MCRWKTISTFLPSQFSKLRNPKKDGEILLHHNQILLNPIYHHIFNTTTPKKNWGNAKWNFEENTIFLKDKGARRGEGLTFGRAASCQGGRTGQCPGICRLPGTGTAPWAASQPLSLCLCWFCCCSCVSIKKNLIQTPIHPKFFSQHKRNGHIYTKELLDNSFYSVECPSTIIFILFWLCRSKII